MIAQGVVILNNPINTIETVNNRLILDENSPNIGN